jgi:uncharacterized protein YciI
MIRSTVATLIIAVALTGAGILMAQTRPTATVPQETFVILYEPGANWIKGKSIYEQDLFEHGQYMAKLLDHGHLELGGPFSDSSGEMAVITAKDIDEAQNILKNDPGVTMGIFHATVRPWNVVFRRPVNQP